MTQVTQGQIGNILLLPEQEGIEVPAKAGVWEGREEALLEKLSVGLRTGKARESIDSIPSMWARPLLFQDALLDIDHPLHEQIVAEWRGLLAIFALKERRSFPLHTELLLIPEGNSSKFIRAARKLLPLEKISDDTSWERIHLLYYGSDPQSFNHDKRVKPIGMTSPVTLVCTAAEVSDRVDEQVSWFINGKFADPCQGNYLSKLESSALRFWLQQVQQKFRSYPKSPQAREATFNGLVGLLNNYIRDVDSEDDQTCRLTERSLKLETGLYKILNHPVEIIEISIEESSVKLVPSDELNPNIELLLLDRNLGSRWGIDNLAEILVYGKETLASFNFEKLGEDRRTLLAQMGTTRLPEGVEWRMENDFFTEKLLLNINTSQTEYLPFPNVLEVEGQKNIRYDNDPAVPILPINHELLKYYSISDLAKRISFKQLANNTIAIELKLTLAGINGVKKDFTISRTYRSGDIRPCSSVPVLEVYPNFRADVWNLYYTYYAAIGQKESDIFYAKPFISDEKPISRESLKEGRLEVEITRSSSLPTAMLCKTLVEKKQIDVGFLLLDLDKFPKVQSRGGTWRIGVDFGTSSSNIYAFRESEAEPIPVIFRERCVQITPSRKDSREESMLKCFLPPFAPETPFASLFKPWRILKGSERGEYERPLLCGNIRYVQPESTLRGLSRDGVKSGFKWDSSQEYINGFLQQLAVQCLAEAVSEGVSSIEWQVSYPIAFSYQEKIIQENVWKGIVDLANSVGIETSLPERKTESFAIASFFRQNPNHKIAMSGTICIDIGGRTSDISIWDGGKLLQQSSVKLAGEDFFTKLIGVKPSVLKKFDIDLDVELEKELDRQNNNLSEIDSLLRQESVRNRYIQALPRVDRKNQNDSAYGLLHITALGLSGLFFYTGLLLKAVIAQNKWRNNLLPTLCIGGNGARTLTWLGLGTFNSETPHNKLFSKAIKVASGIGDENNNISIILSKSPKSEVAYGLVIPTELSLVQSNEAIVNLAGEAFLDAQGNRLDWSANLTETILQSGISVPDNLSNLQAFIDVFNSYATSMPGSYVRKVDLQKMDVNGRSYERIIKGRIQEWLDTLGREQDVDRISIEPLFIKALRELVELEKDEWIKRKD